MAFDGIVTLTQQQYLTCRTQPYSTLCSADNDPLHLQACFAVCQLPSLRVWTLQQSVPTNDEHRLPQSLRERRQWWEAADDRKSVPWPDLAGCGGHVNPREGGGRTKAIRGIALAAAALPCPSRLRQKRGLRLTRGRGIRCSAQHLLTGGSRTQYRT